MPITSYEIREDIAKGDLYFIDAHAQGTEKRSLKTASLFNSKATRSPVVPTRLN